jgi:outer membrane protein OmpA-like peptidoglycan-associated protein
MQGDLIMERKQTHRLFSFATLGAIAISLTLAGCAVGPNADIQRARTSLLLAQQDSQVVTYAPAQLREAEQTLDRAERLWNDTGNRIEVAHLSYIAEQQANIAVAKAQESVAEAEARRLADEREQVRLSMRAREAEFANERAREATIRAQEATARAQEATTRAQLIERELTGLHARDTERGLVMTLPEDTWFEYNRAELRPGATHDLYPLVTYLREHPDRTLLIEGYTDNLGSESYNLDLSRFRAGAVQDFLVHNGITSNRIIAYGYGEAHPVASNDTAVGRQQNRRVEIILLLPGQSLTVR